MPDQDDDQRKKDLAAALQRMAGQTPPATEPKKPEKRASASSRPAAPRLASQRPAAPGSAPPPRPVPPPPQVHRRPVIPIIGSAGAHVLDEAPTPLIEDDDIVIVPAPTPDVFLPRQRPAPPPRASLLASMRLRRTLIPILLTSGVMLPTLGILWFMTDEESPFRRVGMGVPVTLIVVGAVLLLLGLVNAFQVKHQLQHMQQTQPTQQTAGPV
ncbi:MAG TPA: hypothetical protein VH518_05440 [Tepidisphaeraceae bacterium]|jgi:hypothetical protein